MPQRASVFCNFYIRVDREALVSERALDVGSVAFKARSTKTPILAQRSHLFMSQISIRGPRVKSHRVKFPPTSVVKFIYLLLPFVKTKRHHTRLFVK
jgi:hypothetical protein